MVWHGNYGAPKLALGSAARRKLWQALQVATFGVSLQTGFHLLRVQYRPVELSTECTTGAVTRGLGSVAGSRNAGLVGGPRGGERAGGANRSEPSNFHHPAPIHQPRCGRRAVPPKTRPGWRTMMDMMA